MSTRSWGLLAMALAAGACAHAEPLAIVPLCSAPPERSPRPSAECFAEPASQRYAGRLGAEIGDVLSGYRTHPGSAALSVAFDAEGRVGEVCFESYQGLQIAQRIPDAAARVQSLPAAPACFAGRRLDFLWESDAVTDEQVRLAVTDCRRKTHKYRSAVLFMHEAQSCYAAMGCSGKEVRRRWDAADLALRSCVLERVPLVMRTGVTHETLVFDPAPHTRPDPALAVQASAICDGLPRPADVIDCMQRRGWVPRP